MPSSRLVVDGILKFYHHAVKSCIKAAAYVHFFDFPGRLLYETGLCAAVVQLLAAYTVQSMHAGLRHPCVLYKTSHTINSIKKSRFCKPRLLFESGFYSYFKGGFYTRLYGSLNSFLNVWVTNVTIMILVG